MQHDDTTGIIVAVFLLLKMAAIALVLAFYSKPDTTPPDGLKPKDRK